MTLRTWRLVKWQHREVAFTGEGSRLFGGRWNSPGNPVIYTCESQALCALETLAHFDPNVTPPKYAFLWAEFDSTQIQQLPVELPPNWGLTPSITAAIGNSWLQDKSARCVLAVPSSLVPTGWNYLINPRHRSFSHVRMGDPLPYSFDPRILPRHAPR